MRLDTACLLLLFLFFSVSGQRSDALKSEEEQNSVLPSIASQEDDERSTTTKDGHSGFSHEIEQEIHEKVSDALSNHFNVSGPISTVQLFVKYLDKTFGEKGIKELKSNIQAGKGSKPACIAIGTILELAKKVMRYEFEYQEAIELVCKVFKIERPDICNAFSSSFGPHLQYIFTKTKINSMEQVALLLGIDSCFDVPGFQSSSLNWLIPLPAHQDEEVEEGDKLTTSSVEEHQTNEDDDESNDVTDWSDDERTRKALHSKHNDEEGVTRLDDEHVEAEDYGHQVRGRRRMAGIKDSRSRKARKEMRWSGNKRNDRKSRHGHHRRNHSEGRRDENHLRMRKLKHHRHEERRRRGKSSNANIRFLQLTDVHLDLLYKQGAAINCGAPLCCRSDPLNLTTKSICSGSEHHLSPMLSMDPKSRAANQQSNTVQRPVNGEEGREDQWPKTSSQGSQEFEEGPRSGALQLVESIPGTKAGDAIVKEEGAGSWGELEGFCDSPLPTALSILEHINERFSRHAIHDDGRNGGERSSANDARRDRRKNCHDHKVKCKGGKDWEGGYLKNGNDQDTYNNLQQKVGMNGDDPMNGNEDQLNDVTGDMDDDRSGDREDRIQDSNDTIDYILWTGDITPHDVWNSNMEDLQRVVATWSSAMKTYLPKGVPVFPVMGNHDTVPVNLYPPPDVEGPLSMKWIYRLYGSNWESWLGSSALSTFQTGGYYSKTFPLGDKKLMRIIVINTNYCSRQNFWQLYDPVDPGNQLQWLVSELSQAEKAGQVVHIVGHAPITSDACTQTWAHNYFAIINRFKRIIRTSFFGHTHRDELRLYFAPEKDGHLLEGGEKEEAILVGFVGGSITTFGYVNPCYKIYQMNHEGIILDQDTYFLNVTDANERTREDPSFEPKWKYLYTASKEYNIDNLSTEEVIKVHKRMENNDEDMIGRYFNIMTRSSTSSIWNKCTQKCRKSFVDMIRVEDSIGNYFKK